MRKKRYDGFIHVRVEKELQFQAKKLEIDMSNEARTAIKKAVMNKNMIQSSLEPMAWDQKEAIKCFNAHLNFLESNISDEIRNQMRQNEGKKCLILRYTLERLNLLKLHPMLVSFCDGGNFSEQILEEWLK